MMQYLFLAGIGLSLGGMAYWGPPEVVMDNPLVRAVESQHRSGRAEVDEQAVTAVANAYLDAVLASHNYGDYWRWLDSDTQSLRRALPLSEQYDHHVRAVLEARLARDAGDHWRIELAEDGRTADVFLEFPLLRYVPDLRLEPVSAVALSFQYTWRGWRLREHRTVPAVSPLSWSEMSLSKSPSPDQGAAPFTHARTSRELPQHP